jgi:malate dehydrogenase
MNRLCASAANVRDRGLHNGHDTIHRVSTIAILGAGEIGGALARQLAASDVASRIVLVDDQAGVAAGKALDIAQAAPVDRYSTSLSGTSDVSAVTGAAVVVLADRFGPAGEWRGEDGLALLKRIGGLNQVACVVCAGTEQQSLIERGVAELGLARTRLFGSAPEALRAAIVTMAALEAKAAPADVSLSVLGRPSQPIVPWDEGAIAGRSAPHVLTTAQLARLNARVARLWPPGPATLASAAARVIRSALTRSPRVHTALVALTRDEGTVGRSAMLPVTLAPDGIAQIVAPALSSRDRVRLETALRA